MDSSEDYPQLSKIFFPYTLKQLMRVKERKLLLAHYTTSDAAANILRTKSVRMRKKNQWGQTGVPKVLWTPGLVPLCGNLKLFWTNAAQMLMAPCSIVERFDVVGDIHLGLIT